MQSQSCYTNSSFILLPIQFSQFFKSSRPAKGNYNLSTLAWTAPSSYSLQRPMWEQRNWAVILLFRAREQTAWASILSLIWALLCAYNITRRLKDRTESTICCGDHQPYGLSIIKRCICSSPPMKRGFLPESNKAFISVTRLTLKAVFLGSVMFRHTVCSHKNWL